jgi:hypothetical protein
MKNFCRTLIANRGRSIEWSSYFCNASPPSGGFYFRSYKNRGLLENGGSRSKHDCRTPIANRGQPIEWSSYFRHEAPPRGGFRFRSLLRLRKSRITRERWQLDEKYLLNTNNKPGSAYRIVNLLQLGGAICC